MAQFRYIVEDVDASVAFYRDLLGFDLVEQYGPAMANLRRDDLDLWVAGPMASASKLMPDGAQPAPGGWARCVIGVADIEGVISTLRDNGVRFRNDLLDGPGGATNPVRRPFGECCGAVRACLRAIARLHHVNPHPGPLHIFTFCSYLFRVGFRAAAAM